MLNICEMLLLAQKFVKLRNVIDETEWSSGHQMIPPWLVCMQMLANSIARGF